MKRSYLILSILSYICMFIALYMALLYAPTEKSMGDVQRIFYFHVPSAWVSFLGFGIVAVASLFFLRTGKSTWDTLACSAAEVGLLFLTLVLITGPLWAKPVWGVYWTWDARLTTSFILWLIYIGYLMLRNYVSDRQRGARFAAVFGIIGFIDVPIVYMSIRWWRTLHPAAVVGGGADSGLAPVMLATLLVCVAAFTLLFSTLLVFRYNTRLLKEKVEELIIINQS
ncbi:cytochrome C assembly protein [candidate division KSB1 bacterium]|nr:cytochrome c biogenesis protein CcsA [candidate division KSB1 bacterium]RQW07149.1 MAG: cytochrome C assembly protein [candidate division KSB1 bacterium]